MMRIRRGAPLLVSILVPALVAAARSAADAPGVDEDVVFAERDGLVAVEAEHFFRQTHDDVRQWRLTTQDHTPDVEPDGDENHAADASGGAYLEALPDTRRTHDDRLIRGENFSNEPGKLGILHYRVHFDTPGRYYVWGRIHSTGTEDNGLHVGLDGAWPESGQRMQWTDKQRWAWGSRQRTEENHGGERYKLFLDVEEPGEHIITFSMREDGTEFDKWLMTTDREFVPQDQGPQPALKEGSLPQRPESP